MVGMFVQKYEKIFFDFYCGKNFSLRRGDVETWRRSLRSLVEAEFLIVLTNARSACLNALTS